MNRPEIYWIGFDRAGELLSSLGCTPSIGLFPFLRPTHDVSQPHEEYNDYFSLLAGILYAWSDHHPIQGLLGGRASDTELTRLLQTLKDGFRYQTTELLVLDVASKLRKDFSSTSSLAVLKTGLHFLPKSSRLRSDIVVDLAVSANARGSDTTCRQIMSQFEMLDLSSLDDGPRQVVLLCALASMRYLGIPTNAVDKLPPAYASQITDPACLAQLARLDSRDQNSDSPFDWLPPLLSG